MEYEYQQQHPQFQQQPYFPSFSIAPPPFIEAEAIPRRKPFIPNKAALTELQKYQEQQRLLVHGTYLPSSSSSSSSLASSSAYFSYASSLQLQHDPHQQQSLQQQSLQQQQHQQQHQQHQQHHHQQQLLLQHQDHPPYQYHQNPSVTDSSSLSEFQHLPGQTLPSFLPPAPQPLPLQGHDMDIDSSTSASLHSAPYISQSSKQKPARLRKISNRELDSLSSCQIDSLGTSTYDLSPMFFSPTTVRHSQSFGDLYHAEIASQTQQQQNQQQLQEGQQHKQQQDPVQGHVAEFTDRYNGTNRTSHHRHSSYTFSHDHSRYHMPMDPSHYGKGPDVNNDTDSSASQYYRDLPSTPALTVAPRKKRPKSLAAHDFTVGACPTKDGSIENS
ncbi:hypothetical protein BGZ94_003218, partial [Podila epigama]